MNPIGMLIIAAAFAAPALLLFFAGRFAEKKRAAFDDAERGKYRLLQIFLTIAGILLAAAEIGIFIYLCLVLKNYT